MKRKLPALLLSLVILLPETASLYAAPPTRSDRSAAADANVEQIDGKAAIAHLANLKRRREKAFAASVRRLEERGFRRTDMVTVIRSTGKIASRGASLPNAIQRVQETYTSSEGELVIWSFDDGNPATWEGVIYAENYSTGAYATHDAQIDVSTDHFTVVWEEQTGGGGGVDQPHDNNPYNLGAISGRKAPVALLASASLDSLRRSDIQLAQAVDRRAKVDEFMDCFFPNCMSIMWGCSYLGPAAMPCAIKGCLAVAIACAVATLI